MRCTRSRARVTFLGGSLFQRSQPCSHSRPSRQVSQPQKQCTSPSWDRRPEGAAAPPPPRWCTLRADGGHARRGGAPHPPTPSQVNASRFGPVNASRFAPAPRRSLTLASARGAPSDIRRDVARGSRRIRTRRQLLDTRSAGFAVAQPDVRAAVRVHQVSADRRWHQPAAQTASPRANLRTGVPQGGQEMEDGL